MTSFASETKDELCRAPVSKKCCAVAEMYGVFAFCGVFSPTEARIITGNRKFAKRAETLMQTAYGLTFDEERGGDGGKISLVVRDAAKIAAIVASFGFGELVSMHVNLGVLEEECCRVSFLRGAFLAGGSVNNPYKSYHLELISRHRSAARETAALLGEAGFSPKLSERSGADVIYFKRSGAIEELLTLLGAPNHAMRVMEAKIEKEMNQSVNRRVNCDTANVSKTVIASEKHTDFIEKLRPFLSDLPDRLRITAELRLAYPELSITELGAMFSPPISKPGLNHRLRKLREIAESVM
jgi:DNA-binding protein WhiA